MNNRVAPRPTARLRIHYGFDCQQLLADYSVNLSTGGVFIETVEQLAVDTPLTLEFSLPDSPRPIRCRGRVAWANLIGQLACPTLPAGIGVQFLDLTLDDLRALRAFVEKTLLCPSW